MTIAEIQALAASVFNAVDGHIAKLLGRLSQRVDERFKTLELRVEQVPVKGERGPDGAKGQDGKDGRDGRSVELAEVQLLIDAAVGRMPQPKDGAPGRDGTSVSTEDAAAMIQAAVERAVAALPLPQNGKDGRDIEPAELRAMIDAAIGQIPAAKDGTDGRDGKDAELDAKMLRRAVDDAVQLAVAAMAVPKDGAPGRDGKDGVDSTVAGPRGEPGERGASAFDFAKSSGYVGSEADWLLSLRGKDGGPGRDGQNGQDGRDGRDGEKGERGRDAIEMDILDGIDPDRTYPRGTAAVCNGGTFWALRATDPIVDGNYREAGWLCMFRGISIEKESIEDGGRYTVKTKVFSDGTQDVSRVKTQVVVYRGICQAGKAYDAGDMVTYAGSSWIAQRDTKQVPGAGEDWRLAVKRGKDGKDLT